MACRRQAIIWSNENLLPIAYQGTYSSKTWWRHEMKTFSALLAIVRGIHRSTVNSPHKRPVTRSFDVFFDLRLN